MGVTKGDNIGLVSTNRFEWNVMDFAIQRVGGIVVPLYPNISSKDYIYIFNDANLKLAVVGTDELYNKIEGVKSEMPSLEHLFCFDTIDGIPHWSKILESRSEGNDQIVGGKNGFRKK